jgi:hypothetical protein
MRVKVGKEYKCGKEIVKIIAIVTEGLYGFSKVAIGMVADDEGDYHWNTSATCGFDPSDGEASNQNPRGLHNYLEEIKETKEMTVKEISDKLGYEVKVVK